MASITLLIPVAALLAHCLISISWAQYNQGYSMSSGGSNYGGGGGGGGGGGYSYGGNGDGGDDRPKVQLGLRLKIPSFKFELPRMSLPKITISAKIRQPDRPRTIQLPEINLDTTSKVAPPGMHPADGGQNGYYNSGSNYGGGGESYGPKQSYGSSSYSSGGGSEKTISFSSEEHPGSSYGEGYGGNGNKMNYGHQDKGNQGGYHKSQQAYSSTNVHPSYTSSMTKQSEDAAIPTPQSAYANEQYGVKNLEAGFGAPTYDESSPESAVKEQNLIAPNTRNPYPFYNQAQISNNHILHMIEQRAIPVRTIRAPRIF